MWESINRTLINGIVLAFVMSFATLAPLYILGEMLTINIHQQKSYERLVNN